MDVSNKFEAENICEKKKGTIGRDTVTSDLIKKGMLHTKRLILPGQPEDGQLPSTNLTVPKFTQLSKRSITSQKFPCFIPRIKAKTLAKVSFSFRKSHI